MAPTFVQGAANNGTGVSTLAKAFTSNVVAGNLLVVDVSAIVSAASGWSVTDSQGNTYTQVETGSNATIPNTSQIYTAIAGVSGANTVTFHLGAAENGVRMLLHEYSGADTLDQIAVASGNTNLLTATTPATSHAVELVHAYGVSNNGVTAAGAGYTLRETASNESSEDANSSATGAQTATFGQAAANQWVIVMATFYATAGGPTPAAITATATSLAVAKTTLTALTAITATAAAPAAATSTLAAPAVLTPTASASASAVAAVTAAAPTALVPTAAALGVAAAGLTASAVFTPTATSLGAATVTATAPSQVSASATGVASATASVTALAGALLSPRASATASATLTLQTSVQLGSAAQAVSTAVLTLRVGQRLAANATALGHASATVIFPGFIPDHTVQVVVANSMQSDLTLALSTTLTLETGDSSAYDLRVRASAQRDLTVSIA